MASGTLTTTPPSHTKTAHRRSQPKTATRNVKKIAAVKAASPSNSRSGRLGVRSQTPNCKRDVTKCKNASYSCPKNEAKNCVIDTAARKNLVVSNDSRPNCLDETYSIPRIVVCNSKESTNSQSNHVVDKGLVNNVAIVDFCRTLSWTALDVSASSSPDCDMNGTSCDVDAQTPPQRTRRTGVVALKPNTPAAAEKATKHDRILTYNNRRRGSYEVIKECVDHLTDFAEWRDGSDSAGALYEKFAKASQLQRRRGSAEDVLRRVKETATRLQLPTRRSSYIVWKERYLDSKNRRSDFLKETIEEDIPEEIALEEIEPCTADLSLNALKEDLVNLRAQDKQLAQQLLTLYREIHRVKFEKNCAVHHDLMEDLMEDVRDDLIALHEICDFDIIDNDFIPGPNPLKLIGVTKLNLSERRFSMC